MPLIAQFTRHGQALNYVAGLSTASEGASDLPPNARFANRGKRGLLPSAGFCILTRRDRAAALPISLFSFSTLWHINQAAQQQGCRVKLSYEPPAVLQKLARALRRAVS